MTAPGEFYVRVEQPAEFDALLDSLCQPGAASLVFEHHDPTELPVAVAVRLVDARKTLQLDVSSIPNAESVLRASKGFRLLGGTGSVRTAVLTIRQFTFVGASHYCDCEIPAQLDKLQRRETFRAGLRGDMVVGVVLADADDQRGYGRLLDLSTTGCLVELQSDGVMLLEERTQPLRVEIHFPDGTQFHVSARPVRQRVANDGVHLNVGLLFQEPPADQQRQLWQLVREIEREAARDAGSARTALRASPLFTDSGQGGRAAVHAYRTPMVRRLAQRAVFLETQIARLRRGKHVEPNGLADHAEQLLVMHREAREEVLFALVCLHRDPPLVRHGLAVALRLLDIASVLKMPRETCRSVVGAALVHDLGKAWLPHPLRNAVQLDDAGYRQVHDAVAGLLRHLEDCAWMDPAVVEAVVGRINERLDGSGYPHGLQGAELGELARLAAVVDVVDAMSHARPDRPAFPIGRVYEHLLRSPLQFDQRLVKLYISHFGVFPIGTLLRFPGGEMGWVLSRHESGTPAQILLVNSTAAPDGADGTVVQGADVDNLGKPLGALPPPI